jgi:transcriptional regulator with XRE-family HTH domain
MNNKHGLFLLKLHSETGKRTRNDELREAHKSGKLGLYLSKLSSETGKRLCDERIRLGYNQGEFANRLGIHKNTQRNYENGMRDPSAEYYQAAANLGVDIPYVIWGEPILDFPSKAGKIASMVFKRYNMGLNPDAMEALFYILGSSEIKNQEIQEKGENLSSEQIDMLIKIAVERGEEFNEIFSAISYYLTDIEPSDATNKLDIKLLANLIFETVNLYDEVKNRFAHVSLHDNIRLVAQQVIRSHEELNKT